MRYFIWLSYDGTAYHGWQIQPSGNSVQAELQRALSLLLRSDVGITGAGRTDAGVHARTMVAHFDWPEELDCHQVCFRLGRMVPRDISINRVEQVSDDLHARFSATRRTYHYYVHTRKDPFLRHYSWQARFPLDFHRMNEAAALLLEHKDFACFCKSHADVKTTLCDVTEARWTEDAPGAWHFRISANRFLRNMVRAVVGTLVEVGRGRMTIDQFREVLLSADRSSAGESMPGNALFLEEITY